jgi:hypothetical protein
METAAVIAAGLIGVVILFQIGLALGAPWGQAAWGGQHAGRLPTRLRFASVVAVLILVLLAWIVLSAGRVASTSPLPDSWLGPAAWLGTAYFGLGGVVNVISRSRVERVWAAISLLTAVCFGLVAASDHPLPSGAGMNLAPIAEMSTVRAVHSATRLADGRVLVAGGCTNAGCDVGSAAGATAELFDPTTGAFVPTGDLATSRDDHAAILLEDGRVLLAGGWTSDGVTASTELYDPQSGRFTGGPDMSSPRAGIIAVLLEDGRVLLAGGFTDNRPTVASADLFDPKTDSIEATGSLLVPRGAYAAARLGDGRVLVAGGLSDGVVVASSDLYDPRTGEFSAVEPMATARYKAGAVTLTDGRVLVIGGAADIDGTTVFASTEIFDPDAGHFLAGPRMEHGRYKLVGSVVTLTDGRIVVAGGADRAEVLDPVAGSVYPVSGTLGPARLFLTATAIGGDRILLLGGYDDRIQPTAQAWIVD